MPQEQKTNPLPELPKPHEYVLLPSAHIHYFSQIVLLIVGLVGVTLGVLLYVWGLSAVPNIEAHAEITQTSLLFFFLGAGGIMGFGFSLLLAWSLWRHVRRFRLRFLIAICISTVMILSGLLSVSVNQPETPVEYTFYFFALTLGAFSGLLSITYFFIGLSRHVFRTHTQ